MSPKTAPLPPPVHDNPYEPTVFEPTGLDGDNAFETLAEMVRAKRGGLQIPDYLRPLIETGIAELQAALPDLGDHDIARTLMVAASLLNQLVGRRTEWTRIVLMNLLLNIAEQMWTPPVDGDAALPQVPLDDEPKAETADD